jgi:protein-export membrane protein SecD
LSNKWKILSVIAVLVLACYYIYPTVMFYGMSDERREAMTEDEIASLHEKAIKLGLDLRGGMHAVLEVDKSELTDDEAEGALDRAIEVIRNRVDQYGVSEPVIQKQGDDRMVVQLPGIEDEESLKKLIGRTALLEFKLVLTDVEARAIFERLDAMIARRLEGEDLSTAAALEDSALALADSSAAMADTADVEPTAYDSLFADKPLTSKFSGLSGGTAWIPREDFRETQRLLELAAGGNDFSKIPVDATVAWGSEETTMRGGERVRELYVLERGTPLTGSGIQNAKVKFGMDEDDPAAPGVEMIMNSDGRTVFARMTGANVGRQIAIVLEGQVASAPFVREKIRDGVAAITGGFNDKDAQQLNVVLKAGALPAPMLFIEERTVGPSLGSDSIRRGIRAGAVGAIIIVLFMLIYYRGSGFIAILALVLNLFLLFAILAGFKGTLTLPGIAGIVLTIGMAVDANVLIFERIREELRNQKTVRAAIDSGYRRAFVTIIDANVTTLISAIVLYQFGTGPIKGFAVTLSAGIIANMFTAVLVTRLIFDGLTARFQPRKLSI